jgi:hypothetical protein
MTGFLRAQPMLLRMLLPLCMGFTSAAGRAQDCGWSRIDHRVDYDGSGAWNPDAIEASPWHSRSHRRVPRCRTLWQGVDAQIIASVAASASGHLFVQPDSSSLMPAQQVR